VQPSLSALFQKHCNRWSDPTFHSANTRVGHSRGHVGNFSRTGGSFPQLRTCVCVGNGGLREENATAAAPDQPRQIGDLGVCTLSAARSARAALTSGPRADRELLLLCGKAVLAWWHDGSTLGRPFSCAIQSLPPVPCGPLAHLPAWHVRILQHCFPLQEWTRCSCSLIAARLLRARSPRPLSPHTVQGSGRRAAAPPPPKRSPGDPPGGAPG
jgi:hypothetical protein